MKRETYEWCRTWMDHADATDLPRVLLIGDSITFGYQEHVRRLLDGICYVDMVATSYFVDAPIYHTLVSAFYSDLPYAVVHFNHGLHGYHGDVAVYENGLDTLVAKLKESSKVILATSTSVLKQDSAEPHEGWTKRLDERNAAVARLAEKHGCAVDDLYEVSLKVPYELRAKDGFHYATEGYAEHFAPRVAEEIKRALEHR